MKSFNRSLTVLGAAALLAGLAAPAFAQGTGASAPARPATPATPPTREAAPVRPAAPATRDGAPAREGAPARTGAKVGQPAPDFSLPDVTGKMVSLADSKGKIVVLQWINPECPVCQRVMADGVTSTAQTDAKAAAGDVVWLFINSTAGMPLDTSKAYLEKNKSTTPGLIDIDGSVGRKYGAKTTPHIFVIDDKGILRYEGAIDNDERGALAKKGEKVMNYAANAVRQIKAGETVTPDTTKAYGCSVKYAGTGAPPAGAGGTTPPTRGGTTPPTRGGTTPPAGGGTTPPAGGGTGSGK